ncbi:MAG: hypothetical protein HUU20_24220 [Pirellulales bacterium]|nr:hypothetical protein [Pirellulales bacterium]
MKPSTWCLLSPLLWMLLGSPGLAAERPALESAIELKPQSIGLGQSATLHLPPLAQKPGKATVLSLRAYVKAAGPAGCNLNAGILINGVALERSTAAGGERLIGRAPGLHLLGGKLDFSVFSGDKLMILYAADAGQADRMTADQLGATFDLDVTDMLRGVDGNTLELVNHFRGPMAGGLGQLIVQDLRVGYLGRSNLPQPPSRVPKRSPLEARTSSGGVQVAQGRRGGFAVTAVGGPDLLIETALGMSPDTPAVLIADDGPPAADGVKLAGEPSGPQGFRLQARWPLLELTRTLEIRDGLVVWKETWTNRGDATAGVPLRHGLFLRDAASRATLAGSSDQVAVASTAANPTLFLEPASGRQTGYGITIESDWWRLLHSQRAAGDGAEVYTNCLALAPGKSLDLEMTITPVPQGGYWAFINSVRRRWGANATTMDRPMFWGFARKPGISEPVEQMKASLGRLGPVSVVIGPWQRLEPDSRVVAAGLYPKLPDAAPRTTGNCPDLDVDAFLSFKHRESYWETVKTTTAQLREAVPGIRVFHMTHPAMECVYKPLEHLWPIAADAVKTPAGKTFEDGGYSRSWLAGATQADWGVLYYVPRPGSRQMQAYLASAARAMDQCGADGMYSDEFSWAFMSRAYSRYDYSRWDGYSADLDDKGNVLRQKADGGMVTQECQKSMIEFCRSREKFFLANGGSCLRGINSAPHHRFIEGGNGPGWFGQGHLSAVPLVLGNMGDEQSTSGVFAAVRKCLQYGSIYSPMPVNLLLEGSDNFVSKLYPITVVEIGPGFVVGRERIATITGRSFDWPEASGKVRLYGYDKTGKLAAIAEQTVVGGGPIRIEVPDDGMVVVEKTTGAR